MIETAAERLLSSGWVCLNTQCPDLLASYRSVGHSHQASHRPPVAPAWTPVGGRAARLRLRGSVTRTESGRPNNRFTDTCIGPPWLGVNCCPTSRNPISCSFAYPSLADENLKTAASLQLVGPFLHTAAWVALEMKPWVDVWFTYMEGIKSFTICMRRCCHPLPSTAQ